ncbi:1,4-beta-xylanase [Polaribacter reichenbachii]|uniref:Beta-xylanase n=1 Tax=Polaribacter reichenbachii TaxID=996801 RepID=A0A1B8TNS9_9FLAO|nr:endo-1,4-beta-xylanase [Polaribacter reichenbachii]APZ46654.1 1,4-beta-xylanase [Polaribacter reichenbachii]AUC17297.1 1,4-beta-xylanase [Polaribacter reichenbachii]OBY61255.1 1,4-beta-xylanase [Polaribacter reichenbachii]
MVLKHLKTILFTCLTLSLINCKKAQNSSESITLKEVYKDDFLIGTALNTKQIIGEISEKEASLIKKQFNSITAENMMKSMHIQPNKGEFSFDISDKFVELGTKNDMFILAHNLIWHSQLPKWVNGIKDSTELKDFMQNHITKLAGRYKGKIGGWDVVNEALNDDGTLRKSIFYNLLGDQYLVDAFKLAEKADPNAELYYNDYSMCVPSKRDGAIKLVKMLQENGAKIDGIGMQGHWGLTRPTLDEIENSIVKFSSLGVKVMITELDVTVLPSPWENAGADINKRAENSDRMNPYKDGLPEEIQEQLAQRYKNIFKLFLKHKDKIDRVTFWGVNDEQSWKNNWPVEGRSDYTLLFDRNNNPKKAYYEILSLKSR